MQAVGTFPESAYGKMARLVTLATRDETDLLADYYRLSRKIAEQERRQVVQAQIARAQIAQAQVVQAQMAQAQGVPPQVVQPPAAAPQEDAQAKADREELQKLNERISEARKPVQTIAEYIDASLPGWRATGGAVHAAGRLRQWSKCWSAGSRGIQRTIRSECV